MPEQRLLAGELSLIQRALLQIKCGIKRFRVDQLLGERVQKPLGCIPFALCHQNRYLEHAGGERFREVIRLLFRRFKQRQDFAIDLLRETACVIRLLEQRGAEETEIQRTDHRFKRSARGILVQQGFTCSLPCGKALLFKHGG